MIALAAYFLFPYLLKLLLLMRAGANRIYKWWSKGKLYLVCKWFITRKSKYLYQYDTSKMNNDLLI